MMPPDKLRRADLLTAPLLLALGLLVVAQGLRMPLSGTYGGQPIYWYTSPGLFPILIGGLLVVFSAGVLRRAIAEGGQRGLVPFVSAGIRRTLRSRTAGRGAAVAGLLGAYILGLSFNPFGPLSPLVETRVWANTRLTRFVTEPDGINYLLCSFLFLSLTIWLFHRPNEPAEETRSHEPPNDAGLPVPEAETHFARPARRLLFAMSLAAGLSWAVSFVFTELLYVPLP